jgi:FkbM family methyltransferase
MKEIRGMWFPDYEEHLQQHLATGPLVDGRGTYQYHKYDAAVKKMTRFRHAVDIGAHVGLWSRVMSLDFERVTAFEPCSAHIECFVRNLADYDNVTLHECALDEKARTVNMIATSDNSGNTHVATNGQGGEEVTAVPLDSFALEQVDFIKIDVEGYELPVILGGEQTIRQQTPFIVIEQKPGLHNRYGNSRFAALDQLKRWGAKTVWNIGGDYLVRWN